MAGRTQTTGEEATRSSEGGNKEHKLTLTDTKPNEEIEKDEEEQEKPSLSAIKLYTTKNKTKIDRRI